MRRLWVEFFPILCTALESENEIEVMESFIDAIAECVLQLGANVGVSHHPCSFTLVTKMITAVCVCSKTWVVNPM